MIVSNLKNVSQIIIKMLNISKPSEHFQASPISSNGFSIVHLVRQNNKTGHAADIFQNCTTFISVARFEAQLTKVHCESIYFVSHDKFYLTLNAAYSDIENASCCYATVQPSADEI